MKKLLIFDCDGTLVDSEIIATRVFIKYWATHGVNFTEQEFKETFIGTGSNATVVVDTFSKMPIGAKEEGDRLLECELSKHLCAVNGMKDLISKFNVDMCVASNSSLSYVQKALDKSKLREYFGEHVYSAEQVENAKPAPDLFLYAASKNNYSASDCIVIEDSVSGVKAAQNANMKVIAFAGAGHFIPSLEIKLRETNANWFCQTVGELESLLIKLIHNDDTIC